MGLFGGGTQKSISEMTRPQYLQNMIDQLMDQSQTTNQGQWVDKGYAGLNQNQQDAINQLINSDQLNQLSNQLITGGQQGLDTLDSAYGQLQSLYQNGNITPDQINSLAGQLYDQDAVNAAIDAQNYGTKNQLAKNTMTNIAQQTMQDGAGGSAARMQKDMARTSALGQMQNDASNLTNQAYNSAVEQANGILSGNRQQQYSALGALANNGANMAGLAGQGAQMANQANQNALMGGTLMQQNEQGRLNNQYNNQMGAQNYDWQQIQNMLNAAGVLNGAQGMTTTTTQSGGGGGMLGGAMSGAAAGSAFGPWGALAGGALGALSAS